MAVLNISGINSLLPIYNLDNGASYIFYVVAVVNATSGLFEGPISETVPFAFTRVGMSMIAWCIFYLGILF